MLVDLWGLICGHGCLIWGFGRLSSQVEETKLGKREFKSTVRENLVCQSPSISQFWAPNSPVKTFRKDGSPNAKQITPTS